MSLVKAEVVLTTCNELAGDAMVDNKPQTYFVTTGLFPQEVVLGIKAGVAQLSRISLSASGIRHLRIEKCTELTPAKFDVIVDTELTNRENARQLEQFQLNKATSGSNIHFLKFVIQNGYEDFAAIFDISLEGTTE